MKTKISLLIIFLSMILTAGYAQEKSKKQLRQERKIEKEKEIKALIDAKEFVFIGNSAFPQGFRTIDLTTNPNFVEFKKDTINSEMPFFGRGFSNIGYGNDRGLHFKGSPKEYSIEKNKKGYHIKVVVKGTNDEYRLFLSVASEGSAMLSISSNNRSPISYDGDIRPLEKKKTKK